MHWMLAGYMFLFVHRPFEVWPVLATVRLERVYMLVLLATWAFGKTKKRWPSNPLNMALVGFTMAAVVCFAASNWSGSIRPQTLIENYLKIFVFYVVVITTVQDERDLERLIQGFIVVMGIFIA